MNAVSIPGSEELSFVTILHRNRQAIETVGPFLQAVWSTTTGTSTRDEPRECTSTLPCGANTQLQGDPHWTRAPIPGKQTTLGRAR
ncbi:hypothetical protein AVEN_172496-1 [Araneus ventricosus]|uniref:Uncharacterized protein n=1 Tax=Araneus ventricosus TaxID=182803 RepID=A0A4Y2DTV3_ARAVE|nr:hypothetical protein AVEN_172496-1 [Araneus ventricosus]